MRRPPAILILLAALALGAAAQLKASTTVNLDFAELCEQATLICEVEVLDHECVAREDGRIETRYTLATLLPMKGAMSSVQELRLPGGEVGHRGLVIPGMPRFDRGDRVILFLGEEGSTGWRMPTGLERGVYQVEVGRQGKARVRASLQHCETETCTHGVASDSSQSYDDFVQRIFRELD